MGERIHAHWSSSISGPLIRNRQPMRDLSDSRWIKVKGVLFLGLGLAASALLILASARFNPSH